MSAVINTILDKGTLASLGMDRESVALGGSYFSSDPKDRKRDERKRAVREEKGNYEYPRNIMPRGFIPGYKELHTERELVSA